MVNDSVHVLLVDFQNQAHRPQVHLDNTGFERITLKTAGINQYRSSRVSYEAIPPAD